MSTTSIVAVTNRVTKDDDDSAARNRQLADRASELAGLGQMGYTLAHSAVIEGAESVTFVDTLTRIND
jgi:hypothetical protein